MGKIVSCPHCSSDEGFFTKLSYINIPYHYDSNGVPVDNSEMYDNAEKYINGRIAYCSNCGKQICRLKTLEKMLETGGAR